MNNKKMESLKEKFLSKYGFLLSLRHENNTDNLQQNLYRVRIVDKKEEIKDVSQLSYPKSGISLGRCNFKDEPVFYCSDKSTTALVEVLKYATNLSEKDVYLSVWQLRPNKNIRIFPLLDKAKQKGLSTQAYPLEIIQNAEIIKAVENQLMELQNLFYSENYLESACVSDLLFKNATLGCDCIFYPSAIETELGVNLCFTTECFDESMVFHRAYQFDIKGTYEEYKVLTKNYTLGNSDQLTWIKADSRDNTLHNLLEIDLNPYKK